MNETKTILPIGTKVKVKKYDPHYASKEAVIVGVERGYKQFDEEYGLFVDGGLVTLEKNIKNICIPYDFDNDTLKVHHEDYTRVSKFYDHYYTIRVLDKDQLVLTSLERFTILSEPSEMEQSLIQHLIEHEEAGGAHVPVYLRGTIYAYSSDCYVELQNDKDAARGFWNTDDNGFKTIYDSEIVLTETEFKQEKPLAVLVFN